MTKLKYIIEKIIEERIKYLNNELYVYSKTRNVFFSVGHNPLPLEVISEILQNEIDFLNGLLIKIQHDGIEEKIEKVLNETLGR